MRSSNFATRCPGIRWRGPSFSRCPRQRPARRCPSPPGPRPQPLTLPRPCARWSPRSIRSRRNSSPGGGPGGVVQPGGARGGAPAGAAPHHGRGIGPQGKLPGAAPAFRRRRPAENPGRTAPTPGPPHRLVRPRGRTVWHPVGPPRGVSKRGSLTSGSFHQPPGREGKRAATRRRGPMESWADGNVSAQAGSRGPRAVAQRSIPAWPVASTAGPIEANPRAGPRKQAADAERGRPPPVPQAARTSSPGALQREFRRLRDLGERRKRRVAPALTLPSGAIRVSH